jgi:hypothetical protein
MTVNIGRSAGADHSWERNVHVSAPSFTMAQP